MKMMKCCLFFIIIQIPAIFKEKMPFPSIFCILLHFPQRQNEEIRKIFFFLKMTLYICVLIVYTKSNYNSKTGSDQD